MDLKGRLQRVLQIVEEAERTGSLSDLEKDIALNELREAYAELKFGITENGERETENGEQKTENEEQSEIAPITHIEEKMEEEPEVEVELIFDEESEETENGERKTENEQEQEQEITPNAPNASNAPNTPNTPNTPNAPNAPNAPIVEENLSTLHSPLSTPKRSPLLSLYEDEPIPVVGEQFHETPSVADAIACPKGVAESTPVVSLRDAIGLADKFMLIRELFDGDSEAYESAIDNLDKQSSFDDCIIFVTENYTWSPNSQATKLMMDLLQRKYK